MSTAETTAAPAAEPVAATTAPAVSEPAATEPVATEAAPVDATEAAPATTEPAKESVGKDEVKIDAAPVSEGTLTYKAPGLSGLLKSLIPSKKHFWIGSEPVSHESLSRYLKDEKDEKIGHHNVAHASETGKGLLFFAKRAEDKTAPEGIINLADATEVTRVPGDSFFFKVHGKKHEFHAPTRAETDGWVVAIETAVKEAIANKDTVAAGESYKSTHSKLGGAAVAGAAGAATGAAVTKDGVHDGSAASEATATTDKEARSSSKGRSQSRKRASIFGGLIGKKDEKSVERANEKEAKKEVKEEEKHEKAAEKEAKKEEKAEKKAEEAAADAKFHENRKAEEVAAAAVAAPAVGEEVTAYEPTTTGAPTAITEGTTPVASESVTTPTTKQNKRSSIFGFLGKKSGEVPTAKDVSKDAPAPVAEAPVTSSTAPQLDPVDTSIPAETAATTEAPAAATTETAAAEPHSSPVAALENTPEAKAANKQKEGGDLFSFMKKKKAEVDEKKAVDSTEGVAAAEKTEGTSTSPATEKRRSSFFNSLGGPKKERGTSPEGEKKSGLGGLFRKSSKSVKPTTGPVTDSSAPPAIPATAETGAAAAEPVVASTEAAPAAETVAKTELPAATGATTGTDALPTTETAAETTPAVPTTTA